MIPAQSRTVATVFSVPGARDRSKLLAALYSVIFLAVWVGLCTYAYTLYRGSIETARRLQVSQTLSSLDMAIANAVNQRLALVQGLAAHAMSEVAALSSIDADHKVVGEAFASFADALNPRKFGIRNMSLSPQGVVRYVYPMDEANRKVIGNDLLKDPRPEFRETVERAIRTREISLHGPIRLIQGPQGLIARAAIFREGVYWGVVGLVIDLDPILEAASLYQGLDRNLDIAIRNQANPPFFGRAGVFDEQPLMSTIPVPGGYWQIAIVPKQGWTSVPRNTTLVLLGAAMLFGILATTLIWTKITQQEHLASTVRTRTAELRDAYEDVHSRAVALEKANKDLEIAGTVFQNSDEAIVVTDADNRIVSVNTAFTRISGYSPQEVIGQNPSLLASGRHDEAFYRAMWVDLANHGIWAGEIWNRRKNGTIYPEWLRLMMVRDARGRITNHIAIFSDITEKKEAEARILRLAYRDSLTGLANRTLLFDRLDQLIARLRRDGGMAGFLLIDLDRFKMVNDTLGHSVGDDVLRVAGERIANHTPEFDLVARIGGDEFVVIMTSADLEAYEKAARALVGKFTDPIFIGDHEVQITCSVGLSLFPRDGQNAQELMRAADAALYSAKDNGRNRIQFFTADIGRRIADRKVIEDGLRRAIDQQNFCLYYQPQIDLATNRVTGVEALVRWDDPAKGLIGPTTFIPVAEDSGLIVPLSDWIIRSAMLFRRRLVDAGYGRMLVAINISAVLLRHNDFTARLEAITHETGCDPGGIELEITESSIMEDAERSLGILRRFKELGFHVSIDDFGTGYSSLSYLRRFTVDCIKIDQSFVRGLPDNGVDHAIVAAIVAMARNLNFRTIAEGIETDRQGEALRGMGCDIGQGYYFARPMPADDLLGWLQRR